MTEKEFRCDLQVLFLEEEGEGLSKGRGEVEAKEWSRRGGQRRREREGNPRGSERPLDSVHN